MNSQATIVSIRPYQTLGKIEERVDRMTSYLLTHADNDVVMGHLEQLRRLVGEMRQSLDEAQRLRLEAQLRASIALRQANAPSIIEVCEGGEVRARHLSEFLSAEKPNAG